MYDWLEGLKTIMALMILLYASWSDYRLREVSDRAWAVLAPAGLVLTLLHILLTRQNHLLITLALSSLIVSALSIALFYLGFFGGADAKALISLSLTFPYPSSLLKPHLDAIFPLFAISILNNTVLFAALSAIYIATRNVLWRIRTGERLFQGLEEEPSWKKLLALITGYKVEASKLQNTLYLYPLEDLVEAEDGGIKRRLRVFVRADEEREAGISNIKKYSGALSDMVWVTPGLPLLVFMTIGLVTALFLGDIVLWLVFRLMGL